MAPSNFRFRKKNGYQRGGRIRRQTGGHTHEVYAYTHDTM